MTIDECMTMACNIGANAVVFNPNAGASNCEIQDCDIAQLQDLPLIDEPLNGKSIYILSQGIMTNGNIFLPLRALF